MSEEIQTAEGDDLRSYLAQMTAMKKMVNEANNIKVKLKYAGIEEFVLLHGKPFKPAVLPKGIRRGKVKECFSNALHVALDHPEWTYVEGFACGVIPVHHAWLVDAEGTVIDPTWGCDKKKGVIGRTVKHGDHTVRVEARTYFGVPLQLDYVRRTIVSKKTYGVLENWENDFPLLTGKDDVESGKILKV